MKEFKEFRLETFNNLLPLLKEVVDNYFELHVSLRKAVTMYSERLKKLKKEKEALEIISGLAENFSEKTNIEIKNRIEKLKTEIYETEVLISDKEDEIDDCEYSLVKYNNYFIGIGLGLAKNNGKILENAKDVKIEYLREYYYLMFCLDSNYCYGFSREYLLSEDAVKYIIKYLRENEDKEIANKKIEILTNSNKFCRADFFKLFQ